MNTDETYELEERVYVNPTQSRDEQLQFIDNLRDVQTQNNQQIAADTYALGTQVPTNLGGLTSGAGNADSYWMSRYQTPQVQSAVANLQATAQADALSKIMAQDEAQYQNRANQAYRNYQKRERARSRNFYNSLPNNTIAPGGDFTTTGKVTEEGSGKSTGDTTKVDVGTENPFSLGGNMVTVWDKDKGVYKVIRTRDWIKQLQTGANSGKVDLSEDYINIRGK